MITSPTKLFFWTPLALALSISAAAAQEAGPMTPAAPAVGAPAVAAPAAGTPGAAVATDTGNVAVAQGQAAVPLVPIPDVADSGLADVRNKAAADVAPISLDDAVGLALQNNPSPKAARAALASALARIGTAKAAGGPQLGLSGSATAQRGSGNVLVSTGTGDVGGFSSSEALSLNASLPIYNGGRVKASRRVAEAQARAQLAAAQQTEQDLAAQTILSYLSILQNQQLLDVADGNLSVSRERRRVAGVRFDAGAAARLEVLSADSDLAAAQQRRIAASNNVAQSKAILNILLVRNPETPLNAAPIAALTIPAGAIAPAPNQVMTLPAVARFPLTDQATAIAAGGAIPTSASLRTVADANLPSLQSARETVNAADQNVALQKSQRKPNLTGNLAAALSNPSAAVGRFLISVGVGVAQTIFDSGRIKSQIKDAQGTAQQVRFNLDSQQLQVANVIESALLQLDSSRKRQSSADVGVLSAQEALRAAQLGYAAGASTSLDVTVAQNALLAAQTDAVNARFEVAQAQVQLAAATSQTATGRTTTSATGTSNSSVNGSGSTFSSSSTGSSTGVSTVSTSSSSSQTGTSTTTTGTGTTGTTSF